MLEHGKSMSKNYIIQRRSLVPLSGRASGMDTSTTLKRSRAEQCKINAHTKSEKKRQAAFDALSAFQRERRPITKAAVARRAGVSVVFLRKHPDLVQAIEDAERTRPVSPPINTDDGAAKDQVIAAKHQLAAKDLELRQKQREIDRLHGKLAAASPLTARDASPPVRVERDRPCEVKAVQVEGSGVGARSSERQRRALTRMIH
jgi:hypothetical protein